MSNLQAHMKTRHQVRAKREDIKTFKQARMKTTKHRTQAMLTCNICEAVVKGTYSLTRHMKRKHNSAKQNQIQFSDHSKTRYGNDKTVRASSTRATQNPEIRLPHEIYQRAVHHIEKIENQANCELSN